MKAWSLAGAVLALMMATESGCDSSSTPPKVDSESSTILLILHVDSAPQGAYVIITVDARDHAGLPSVNLELGRLYPTTYPPLRTPFTHLITHPGTAVVTYTVEAFMGGVEGDLLTCGMTLNGAEVRSLGTPHVAQVLPGSGQAHVLCEYTYYPGTRPLATPGG